MKDKDTKLLEEAYDTISNKTNLIDKFLRKYLFEIRLHLQRIIYYDNYNPAHNASLINIKEKLGQFYKHPEYKQYIDDKIQELGLSPEFIISGPSKSDIESIRRMDFSDPIL